MLSYAFSLDDSIHTNSVQNKLYKNLRITKSLNVGNIF